MDEIGHNAFFSSAGEQTWMPPTFTRKLETGLKILDRKHFKHWRTSITNKGIIKIK